MSSSKNINFEQLNYESFRKLAGDSTLSKYEKIGFPDSYRSGFEESIFADIIRKLPRLQSKGKTVLDIGPGCSDLPGFLVRCCRERGHRLLLVDSPEMLGLVPDEGMAEKIPGLFPKNFADVAHAAPQVDVILAYSILHYVHVDADVIEFLDRCLELLAPEGELLIGDIPNISKRRRFFSSEAGVRYHREFTKSSTLPDLESMKPGPGKIDDELIFALLRRAREAGADAYVLPQDEALPMANRREDILIRRP